MGQTMQPFNIRLLRLTDENRARLKPITALDIYDGATKNFHPAGLFSTEIFGKVGSPQRMEAFGYIRLHVDVFHPVSYRALCALKELYRDIMAGKAYAKWDPKLKDFERSDAIQGETGYAFFMRYWNQINHEKRNSGQRNFNIALLDKYKEANLIDNFLVLPAGYRDLELDSTGRPTEDEINTLYRRVLSIAELMRVAKQSGSIQSLDSSRYNLQLAINEVYEYLKVLLDGKNKIVQGRVATRKIFDSTRNVITAATPVGLTPDDPRQLSPNDTPVGIYQYMVAIRPIAYRKIRDGILNRVFPSVTSPSLLVNAKTLRSEMVQVPAKDRDSWMTREGLEKRFKRYAISSLRHEPAMCGEYYIALRYLDDQGRCRVLQSIDELPEGFDRKYVKPLTVTELFYLSIADTNRKFPSFLTRYPVTGYGSVYPTLGYIRTTIKTQRIKMLDSDWQTTINEYHEYPIEGVDFFESMSPTTYHLGRLGGDHDGDMTSWLSVMTQESIRECMDKLEDPSYYVTIDKKPYFSTSNDVLSLVLKTMCA